MKYKKLIFLLCFVFGILFFIPSLSHAAPACSLTATCATIDATAVTTNTTPTPGCGLTATCAIATLPVVGAPCATCNYGYTSNSGSTVSSDNGGSKTLNVTSSSKTSSILSSAEQATRDIKTQVNQEQTKYNNQVNQMITSVCGTSPECQNLYNIQTQLYQIGTSYTKPIFSTNATGTMHVGDIWNITVTELIPGETIYATGGKIINGVVPADKTPYTANGLGIFFQTGSHTAGVIGDWKIVWTRADGTLLGTMVFSVVAKVIVTTSVIPKNTTNPLGNGGQTCGLTATCR